MRYRISPEATFRVRARKVEAKVGQYELSLSRAFYSAVLAFSEPLSIAEAHSGLGGPVTRAQFAAALRPLIEHGLLKPERPPRRERTLRDLLNPAVWTPTVERKVKKRLHQGAACVLRDAFLPSFARRLAEALESTDAWRPGEVMAPFFGYKLHLIENPALFPPELAEAERVLGNDGSRRYVEELSGANCRGPISLTASLYLPGDYSLPHMDRSADRSLTFLWYLTRRWSSSWGGQLFWCPTGQFFMPTFNTLILFRTSNLAPHLVCPVSPKATGRRLTVNGWWTTDRPLKITEGHRIEARRADWYYGKELKVISPHAFVIP
jgi:hypothetical protein